MKSRKLAQCIVPMLGTVAFLGGCATTNDLYAKYDDLCDVPKTKVEERVKVVKEVVHKDRIVEKIKPVETIKYVDRIKEVPTVKVVEKYIKQPVLGEVWEPAVYFGFDSAVLKVDEMARLDRDLIVLKKNPQLKLSIQSFTDSKGSASYNRNLAVQRQSAVESYLMSKGLEKSRILVTPLGEELPILGNSKKERVINRRVELMLLDSAGRPMSLSVQPKNTSFNAPTPVR